MKNIGIKNVITGIFVVGAVAAFMVFSGVIKLGSDAKVAKGTVTIWGTTPYALIQPHIEREENQNLTIIYKEKNINNYESELINALAAGQGPDLFMLPHESILRNSNKLLEIPYASFPRSSYEETYINEARLFLTDTGVLAFPITVDPMIMYYNKSLVASAFLLDVPAYWEELADFSKVITQYSGTGEINLSGAALGTFDNVSHAKAILSSLMIQNNSNLVGTDPATNKKRAEFTLDKNELLKTEGALAFYTSFAQFGSNTYSWNEALIQDQDKFISGELALYFGRGSEVENIRKKNPNLDFGVALFPQVKDSLSKATDGSMMGIAVSKQSRNIPAAILVASKISGKTTAEGLSKDLITAPARKDLLQSPPDDAFKTLVYKSAIISRGWLDADPIATDTIFRNLIRSVNSGKMSAADALATANADINNVLNKTINTIIPNKQ